MVTIDYAFTNAPTDDDSLPLVSICFQDFFNRDLEVIAREADDAATADIWLQCSYRGPDFDGIGVEWTITDAASGAAQTDCAPPSTTPAP